MRAYVLASTVEPAAVSTASRRYRFRGAQGACEWPIERGLLLASCGMWNFLWRIGVHPLDCTFDRLPDPAGSMLWASVPMGTRGARLAELRQWIRGGGYLVATGDAASCSEIFGWDSQASAPQRTENPYAALAYALPGRDPELFIPPGWCFATCARAEPGAQRIGTLLAVQGERQTPARALLVPLPDAPAIVIGQAYCYLNGDPFAAFQAWLQGQEDLQPWLNWRNRLFWLDEWVSSMADVLTGLRVLPPDLARPGIPGLGSTAVVLRHDVDHSRDVTYLQDELSRGLTSTNAVLRDSNTAFWRRTLAEHPGHESGFHYNTGRRDWLWEARAQLRRPSAHSLLSPRNPVPPKGLLRQVQWAKTHGIGVGSILRHLGFLVYPEWVDALNHVFCVEPEVLGGNSLFRAQILRWGADRVDGAFGTVGEWPDPQFPLWLPFKLAHAGLGGRRLSGWESTSMMESEPGLVDQMLSHKSRHLPQRVITLGYHPAHARGTTFHRAGTRPMFLSVLDVIAEHRVQVENLSRVFQLANVAIGA